MKIDGVIDAVRYTPGGAIRVVRSYERHGAVWSDLVLLDRTELVARLRKGQRFMTGERKEYLGSVFTTRAAVRFVGDHIVTDGQPASRDLLSGVSIF